MAHSLRALVARPGVLRPALERLPGAVLAPLEHGLALLPLTREVLDAMPESGAETPNPHDEVLYYLSAALARLGAELSARGPVAYVETDYFGGSGDQGAIVWDGGVVVEGPARARGGPINDALRRLGVETKFWEDAFSAVGLERHRRTDDWAETAKP